MDLPNGIHSQAMRSIPMAAGLSLLISTLVISSVKEFLNKIPVAFWCFCGIIYIGLVIVSIPLENNFWEFTDGKRQKRQEDISKFFQTFEFSTAYLQEPVHILNLFSAKKVFLFVVFVGQIALNLYTVYGNFLSTKGSYFYHNMDMLVLHCSLFINVTYFRGFLGLFRGLRDLSSFSCMIFIQSLTPASMWVSLQRFKLLAQGRAKEWSPCSRCEHITMVSIIISNVVTHIVLGVIGLGSLRVKMQAVDSLATKSIFEWTPPEFIRFAGFVNMLLNLKRDDSTKLQVMIQALFGRDDADVTDEELKFFQEVMEGALAEVWNGPNNFSLIHKIILTCTMDADDLQKIICRRSSSYSMLNS